MVSEFMPKMQKIYRVPQKMLWSILEGIVWEILKYTFTYSQEINLSRLCKKKLCNIIENKKVQWKVFFLYQLQENKNSNLVLNCLSWNSPLPW